MIVNVSFVFLLVCLFGVNAILWSSTLRLETTLPVYESHRYFYNWIKNNFNNELRNYFTGDIYWFSPMTSVIIKNDTRFLLELEKCKLDDTLKLENLNFDYDVHGTCFKAVLGKCTLNDYCKNVRYGYYDGYNYCFGKSIGNYKHTIGYRIEPTTNYLNVSSFYSKFLYYCNYPSGDYPNILTKFSYSFLNNSDNRVDISRENKTMIAKFYKPSANTFSLERNFVIPLNFSYKFVCNDRLYDMGVMIIDDVYVFPGFKNDRFSDKIGKIDLAWDQRMSLPYVRKCPLDYTVEYVENVGYDRIVVNDTLVNTDFSNIDYFFLKYKNIFNEYKDFISNIFDKVKYIFDNLFEIIEKNFNIYNKLFSVLIDNFALLNKSFVEFYNYFRESFAILIEKFDNFSTKVFTKLIDNFQKLNILIEQIYNLHIDDYIYKFIDYFVDKVFLNHGISQENVGGLFYDTILRVLNSIIDPFVGAFLGILKEFWNFLEPLITELIQVVFKLLLYILLEFTELLQYVTKHISDNIDKLVLIFSNLLEIVFGLLMKLYIKLECEYFLTETLVIFSLISIKFNNTVASVVVIILAIIFSFKRLFPSILVYFYQIYNNQTVCQRTYEYNFFNLSFTNDT